MGPKESENQKAIEQSLDECDYFEPMPEGPMCDNCARGAWVEVKDFQIHLLQRGDRHYYSPVVTKEVCPTCGEYSVSEDEATAWTLYCERDIAEDEAQLVKDRVNHLMEYELLELGEIAGFLGTHKYRLRIAMKGIRPLSLAEVRLLGALIQYPSLGRTEAFKDGEEKLPERNLLDTKY